MSGIRWCKNHIKLLCIDGLGVVLAILLSVCMQQIVGRQYSQQQADRWQGSGDIRYHQVSVFLQADSGMNREVIMQVRSQLQNRLLEAGFAPDSVTGRLWVDSYMAVCEDSISKTSELGTSGVDRVHIMGVGGDFFYFHPMELLSGSPFSDGDVSQDKVFIDEETAWTLYGASDIAGKTVEIAGNTFVISGVYRASGDKTEKLARGKDNYIFMDYDTFHGMYAEKNILCYEAALPNPVKGFAILAVKEAMGESTDDMYTDGLVVNFSDKEYVDNTSRFDNWQLLRKLFASPRLLMRTSQIAYPYWENSIRALEFRLEILLLLQILCLICPVITVCILTKIIFGQIRGFFRTNAPLWRDAAIEKLDERARKKKERRQTDEG